MYEDGWIGREVKSIEKGGRHGLNVGRLGLGMGECTTLPSNPMSDNAGMEAHQPQVLGDTEEKSQCASFRQTQHYPSCNTKPASSIGPQAPQHLCHNTIDPSYTLSSKSGVRVKRPIRVSQGPSTDPDSLFARSDSSSSPALDVHSRRCPGLPG